MKSLFAAVLTAGLFAFSGTAFAQAMDGTFGNTVTIADADGNLMSSYYFDADGTLTLVGADGTEVPGTWAESDGELCLTVGEETTCSDVEGGRGPGDTWEETLEDGSTITISIVEGR